MVAAAKPTPGGPVESTWGGQVHDAAVLVRGVTVVGDTSSEAGVLPNTKCALTSVIEGDATMLDNANDQIIIPFDGLWHISCQYGVENITDGAARMGVRKADGSSVLGGSSGQGAGNVCNYVTSGYAMLTAGERLDVYHSGLSGSSETNVRMSVTRLTVLYVGAGLG